MPANRKSTKAGGRDYNAASVDSPVGPNSLHICDQEKYHANSGGPVMNDGYAPCIPDVAAYEPYNDQSFMGASASKIAKRHTADDANKTGNSGNPGYGGY